MSKAVQPDKVMTFLNDFFLVLDSLSEVHGVQKVETAGDCYIVAAGILEVDDEGFSKVRRCWCWCTTCLLSCSCLRPVPYPFWVVVLLQVNEKHDAAQSAAKVYSFACDMLAASRMASLLQRKLVTSYQARLTAAHCSF